MVKTIFFILTLLFVTEVARASDSLDEQSLAAKIQFGLYGRNWDILEGLAVRYRNSAERTASGIPMLDEFYATFDSRAVTMGQTTDETLRIFEGQVSKWLEAKPQSVAAKLAHAKALRNRAWFLRGDGYASDITPERMEGFVKYGRLAAEYLISIKDDAASDAEWYVTAIRLLHEIGYDPAETKTLEREAMARHPGSLSLQFEINRFNLPQWGGSAEELEEEIDKMTRLSGGDGEELYARNYWAITQTWYRSLLFVKTRADWPRMKTSFDVLVAKYPDPLNISAYAYFACLASDRATTEKLFETMNDQVIEFDWVEKGKIEACRQWARSS